MLVDGAITLLTADCSYHSSMHAHSRTTGTSGDSFRRLDPDTNTVERAIRPIALAYATSLFAGSDGGARHWAIVASLVATARLNGVEPQAWLTDVLARVVSGRTKAHELGRLQPWTWQAQQLTAAVDA
jgi:transposase